MLASQQSEWVATAGGFTGMSFLAVGFAMAFHSRLPKLLLRDPKSDPAIPSRVAFALLLLGWGPFMAFHLQHIPGLASLSVNVSEGSALSPYLPLREVALLPILRLSAILLGSSFSVLSLWRIRARARRQEVELLPWGWRLLSGLTVLYVLTALALLLQMGLHP